MPAQQPKQGLQYELLVAAALKTEPHEAGGKSLDLTSFTFNVNPQTYKTILTRMGVDFTVDSTAIRDSITFLIECKSSDTPGEVLRLGSESFLKAVLEFTALQNFSEISGWNYQYLLAVNFPIGREVQDLFKSMSPEQLSKLANRVKEFGVREYGSKFNADLITTDLLRRTFNVTNMILLTDQFLREKLRSDDVFKKHYEDLSSKLRTPRLGTVPERGVLISQGYQHVTFLCMAETHENCRELAIDGFVCHIGNASELLGKIQTAYEKMGSPVCCLIRGRELEYSPYDVEADEKASSKDIAQALSNALNNLLPQINNSAVILLVVPGTFDIVIADRRKLANLIRSSCDPISGKYDLRKIPELDGLGILVQVSLATQILRQEYKIMTSIDNYLTDEGIKEDCDYC